MKYRICLSVQPTFLEVEETAKWADGQVYQEYPKVAGMTKLLAKGLFTSFLGRDAPNVSLVLEHLTGEERTDGTPSGCYGSIYRNESDISIMHVEYPILDYDKVNPFQVIYEGPLSLISTYRSICSTLHKLRDL